MWLVGWSTGRIKAARAFFDALDTNHDGLMTQDEFVEIAATVRAPRRPTAGSPSSFSLAYRRFSIAHFKCSPATLSSNGC